MSHNERIAKHLQQLNWLLTDKCTFSLPHRLDELAKIAKFLDAYHNRSVVMEGSEAIRDIIFPIVCKLVLLAHHEALTPVQRSLVEGFVKTVSKVFYYIVNLCFPLNWQSLLPQIGSALLKDTLNVPRVDACLRVLVVMFKSTEYRLKEYATGSSRDMLVKATHPHLLPIFVQLVEKKDAWSQADLNAIRRLLRIFIASNRVKIGKSEQSYETRQQWLACAQRIITHPPAIPDPQGAIGTKNPLEARVISRAYECFFHFFRTSKMIPNEKRFDHFKVIIRHAVAFFHANVGRPQARDPVASIITFISGHHKEYKTLMTPYVLALLSKCLYPALKMNAQYRDDDDNVRWDEVFYDKSLLGQQPQIDGLIRELTNAHPAVRQPFIRFLVATFKQCTDHLRKHPDNHAASLAYEAAMRAFAQCEKFVTQSVAFSSTLRECFSTYFLPALVNGSPLTQAAVVRMVQAFADNFKTPDAHEFLSMAIAKMGSSAAPPAFVENVLSLIDAVAFRNLCAPIIGNSFDVIMRTTLRSLDNPNCPAAADLVNTLAEQEIYLDRMVPYISDLIGIVLTSIMDVSGKDNDFDSDFGLYYHNILETIAKLVVAYQHTVECGTVPQWLGILRSLLKALVAQEFIDLRASALLLLNCVVCIDIDPSMTTSDLVVQYIRESGSEYFNESQRVFRSYYSLGIGDERRLAATNEILRITHVTLKQEPRAIDCLFFLAWLLNKNVPITPILRSCLGVICRNIQQNTDYTNASCAFIAAMLTSSMGREFIQGVTRKWSRAAFFKAWLECSAVKSASSILTHKTLGALASCIAYCDGDARSLSYIKLAGQRLIDHLTELRDRPRHHDHDDERWAIDPDANTDDDDNDGDTDMSSYVSEANQLEDFENDDDSESEPWSESDEALNGEEIFTTVLNALD